MDREQHYERIRRNGLKLIAELEQVIRDIQWWNRNRTDCPPFDCEWAIIAKSLAQQAQEAWERGDTIESGRITARMVAVMQSDPDPYEERN